MRGRLVSIQWATLLNACIRFHRLLLADAFSVVSRLLKLLRLLQIAQLVVLSKKVAPTI